MALMTALNLKEPKAGWSWNQASKAPAAVATDTKAPTANKASGGEADRLKAELAKRMKDTIALASGMTDKAAKTELAATLQAADEERRKADATGDPAKRAQAYEATLAKLDGAAAKAKGSAAPNGADAKAEAVKLRPQIEKQQADARAEYAKLAPELVRVDEQIAAAKAAKKTAELAELQKKKTALDEQMAPIEHHLKQLDADAKALANPSTDTKTYNEILARQKSGANVVKQVQVDKHDSELEKKTNWREMKRTDTETELKDGNSTTTTNVKKTQVGADGLTHGKTGTKEEVKPDGSKTTTTTTGSTHLGKDGVTCEKGKKTEVETSDGKTSSKEDKVTAKVGPGGASIGATSTEKNADGSGSSQTSNVGVERGEGKVGVTRTDSGSKTNANGTTTTTTSNTKGGLIAGKDGLGAYAEKEKGVEKKSAGGWKAGAVAGLNANVVCNITPKGGEPPTYELSISINLGVKAGVSAGRDKEGGTLSGNVGASGSKAVSMNRRYVLSEAEVADYVAGVKAASAGGGGTRQEFAIISTGVNKSWDAAREMYLALSGKATDKKEVAKLKEGESIEVSDKETLGGNVGLGGKGKGAPEGGLGVGVGLEGGYEESHEKSTKVTREKDGTLTYDTKDGKANKLSGGAKLNVGLAEGGMTHSRTNTTSTGYKINIDPKADGAGKMQDELAACKSQADLDKFAKKYPQTVQEKTKGEGKAENTGASLGVGPVKASIGFGTSNEEEVTVDKDGKFVKKVIKGGNQGSDELAIGKFKIGSKSEEQAVAEIDADGNASLDTTKKDSSTNTAKWLEANVPFAGNNDKGALKTAGGEAEDTDDHDIKGITLSGSDLAALGRLACTNPGAWNKACDSPSQLDDWDKARKAIKAAGGDKKVVAEQLAKFVGSDNSRAKVIDAAARPTSNSTMGTRGEFPGGLAASRADYQALVAKEAELTLDAIEKKDGKDAAIAAGEQMLAKLDSLDAKVGSEQHFSEPSIGGEMLAAINRRRQKVQAKLRVLKGGKADQPSGQENLQRYNALLDNCIRHQNAESGYFAQIEKTFKGSGPNLDETIANGKAIKQLKDLHAVWQKEFTEMEGLSKAYGYGADRYFKYKPDTRRLARAEAGPAPTAADKGLGADVESLARDVFDPGGETGSEATARVEKEAVTFNDSHEDFHAAMVRSGLQTELKPYRTSAEYNAIVDKWQAEAEVRVKGGTEAGQWRVMAQELVAKCEQRKAAKEAEAAAKKRAEADAKKREEEAAAAKLAELARVSMAEMEAARKAAQGSGNTLNNDPRTTPGSKARKEHERGMKNWFGGETARKQAQGLKGQAQVDMARQATAEYNKAFKSFETGKALR